MDIIYYTLIVHSVVQSVKTRAYISEHTLLAAGIVELESRCHRVLSSGPSACRQLPRSPKSSLVSLEHQLHIIRMLLASSPQT